MDHLLLSVYYQSWEVKIQIGDSYCQVLGSHIKICPYQQKTANINVKKTSVEV